MKSLKEYEQSLLREKEIADYFQKNGIYETMKRYGLTKSRIYQIRDSAYKKLNAYQNREIEGLPTEIRNALFRDDIKTTENLREFYRAHGKRGLLRIGRIGVINSEIISDYLENGNYQP